MSTTPQLYRIAYVNPLDNNTRVLIGGLDQHAATEFLLTSKWANPNEPGFYMGSSMCVEPCDGTPDGAIITKGEQHAVSAWPTHRDGRPMKLGEMAPAVRRQQSKAAIERVAVELQRNAPAIAKVLRDFDHEHAAKATGSTT